MEKLQIKLLMLLISCCPDTNLLAERDILLLLNEQIPIGKTNDHWVVLLGH